jgi:uncharacterized protein YecT (DUF1311 family)
MKMRFGRLLTVIFCGSFVLLPLAFGQQSTVTPKKVFTPEQKAYQQQWKEYMAKRQSLAAQAKQIFDTEMAREKARGCSDANSTYDINICYEKLTAITDQNLKSYEELIRELLAPGPRMPGETDTDTPGIAGISLTPGHQLAEFERVEKSWQQYRETACTAAFHQFDGGTSGPSFEMECELTLTRDHIRELRMIYGEDLLL